MDGEPSSLERVLKRDRHIVVGGLVFVSMVCWLYILTGPGMGDMAPTTEGAAPGMRLAWTPAYAGLMLAMWWVMMAAMMLPSAAPMVLLFAAVNRKARRQGQPYVATSVFTAGYLVAWAGFSLVAVFLQWGLERLLLLSPMLHVSSLYLGAALLIAAGVYQLTPLKHACLRHCRSPVEFVARYWRPGTGGAFRMGLQHGLFCLGCCWVLMVLLFYAGIMNLWWIGGLALYVALEKLAPAGHRVGRYTGGLLVLCGAWILAGAIVR